MAENTKTDEPYLRTLAYAMESMSHAERVDALKDFRAETAHQILGRLEERRLIYPNGVPLEALTAERNKYPLNKEES